MRHIFRKPSVVFVLLFMSIFLILLFIPIPLLDAEIVFNNGVSEWTVPTKMSFSHFVGIGISEKDLVDVKSYGLTSNGYFLAALFTIAFPLLIAYRVHIANQLEEQKK